MGILKKIFGPKDPEPVPIKEQSIAVRVNGDKLLWKIPLEGDADVIHVTVGEGCKALYYQGGNYVMARSGRQFDIPLKECLEKHERVSLVGLNTEGEFSFIFGLRNAVVFADKKVNRSPKCSTNGSISFSVIDGKALYEKLNQPDAMTVDDVKEALKERVVCDIASKVFSEFIGSAFRYEDLVSGTGLKEYQEKAKKELMRALDEYGIEVKQFTFNKVFFQPTEEYEDYVSFREGLLLALSKKVEDERIDDKKYDRERQEKEDERRYQMEMQKNANKGEKPEKKPAPQNKNEDKEQEKVEKTFLICPRCGTKNDGGNNFCKICGEKLK